MYKKIFIKSKYNTKAPYIDTESGLEELFIISTINRISTIVIIEKTIIPRADIAVINQSCVTKKEINEAINKNTKPTYAKVWSFLAAFLKIKPNRPINKNNPAVRPKAKTKVLAFKITNIDPKRKPFKAE